MLDFEDLNLSYEDQLTSLEILSGPKRVTITNFVTPSPTHEDKIKPLPSKAASSHQFHSTVSSALVAFNLSSNAASNASLRPKE